MSLNPFEVLRLDPSATEEEIVLQAGRLRRRATEETTRNTIRQAVQALTANPQERLRLALLTHAAPCHHWPALDRFAAAFRRAPTVATASCPPLDIKEFEDLIKKIVAEELEWTPPPFEPIAENEPAEEITRQTAEALWQSLLFDTRS